MHRSSSCCFVRTQCACSFRHRHRSYLLPLGLARVTAGKRSLTTCKTCRKLKEVSRLSLKSQRAPA